MRNFLKDDDAIRVLLITVSLIVVYFFVLSPLGLFANAALKTSDMLCRARYRLAGARDTAKIAIVTIDDRSIQEVGGKWPWGREIFGRLIGNLADMRAKVIAVDIAFLGETKGAPEQDAALAREISRAGNVILSSYVTQEGELAMPSDIFLEAAASAGIVNKPRDRDLIIRTQRLAYYFPKENAADYSFELKAALLYSGLDPHDIHIRKNRIALRGRAFNLAMPINYKAAFRDFKLISAAAVLKGGVSPEDIRGRIVLVGQTSELLHDVYPTPLGLMPGVGINANALMGLLDKEGLAPAPLALRFIVLAALAAGLALFLFYSSVARGFVMLLAALFLTFAFALYSYLRNTDVSYFDFIMAVFAGTFSPAAYRYAYTLWQGERLKRLAVTDELTGAATYRFFRVKLQFSFKEALKKKARLSVVLAVITNARALYDELGPDEFDRALKEAGRLLKDNIGRRTFLGRYKEEGFGIILWRASREETASLLRRLQDEIARSALKIELKIGAAIYPDCRVVSSDELLRAAAAALARRDISSQGRIAIFEPAQDKIVEGQYEEAVKLKGLEALDYVGFDLEERNRELVAVIRELNEAHRETERAYFESLYSLIKVLEEKDIYTAGHSERVSRYAALLAQRLNLPSDEIELIKLAAPLHDIGKIGVPDAILRKKERLSGEETDIMRRHQVESAKILEGVKFFKDMVPLVLYHHERYDGKGYPHGLSGDLIPRGAQIIAIADSFDAMTTGRGYNVVMPIQDVKEELARCAGAQFNPSYVKAFIELIDAGLTANRI